MQCAMSYQTEYPLSKYCTSASVRRVKVTWVPGVVPVIIIKIMKLLSDHVLQQQWNRVENTEDGNEPLIVFFIAVISHLLLAYAVLLILRHLF